jgi:hypothetical protein
VEGVVLGQIDIVLEADEPLGVADELVGEREPDRPVHRVDDQGHHQDQQRQQEEQRRPRLPDARALPQGSARPHHGNAGGRR